MDHVAHLKPSDGGSAATQVLFGMILPVNRFPLALISDSVAGLACNRFAA